MNQFALWVPFLTLTKLLFYLAVSTALGGISMLLQSQKASKVQPFHMRYILFGCAFGVLISASHFFLQVGQFAELGVLGMWNTPMLDILWHSSVGSALQLQIFVWLTVGMAVFFMQDKVPRVLFGILILTLLLPASMSLAGHTAEQDVWVRVALTLHASVGLWWMGSLLPLWHSCRVLKAPDLQIAMHRFGIIATVLVPVLLITGIAIAYALTGSLANLFGSTHGQLLLVKTMLVVVLLGFAAWHKLQLVPRLQSNTDALHLGRSIAKEAAVGLLLLLLTAVLSTSVGPVDTM